MAKNDTILIDGIIAELLIERPALKDRGTAFEYFVLNEVLKDYDLSEDEIDEGWTDGTKDGGIDGFFLFVNGRLTKETTIALLPRSNVDVDVFIVNCKHHDTFLESTTNTILATVQDIFDFSKTDEDLIGEYSSQIRNKRKSLISVYRALASSGPNIGFHYIYASRGDSTLLGDTVAARGRQIVEITKSYFSRCTAQFSALGAAELVERNRKTKTFSLTLPFMDHLLGPESSYIMLVRLEDYFKFVSSDDGALRRYLFDSNVRDYLGDNRVNEDIAQTLGDEKSPDFWWLNNGITILSTSANISGKEIHLTDVQVVNGLQTTETIFRHFQSGSKVSSDRYVAVKVLTSTEESVRDKVVQATNNQSVVEYSSLHATDKIQRDIEEYLEKHDWYYERRRNYYKNAGRPISRFVTPLFLATSFCSLVLKNPTQGANLRNRFMRNKASYDVVFSENFPLEAWPAIVTLTRHAETELLAFLRQSGPNGEVFLRSWRGMLALCYVAVKSGTFDYRIADLISAGTAQYDEALMKDVWAIIDSQRSLLPKQKRPSRNMLKNVVAAMETAFSISGGRSVGRRELSQSPSELAPDVELTSEFLDSVNMLLPEQPWARGVHIEVAGKLGRAPKMISEAIKLLIADGRRQNQIDGQIVGSDGIE